MDDPGEGTAKDTVDASGEESSRNEGNPGPGPIDAVAEAETDEGTEIDGDTHEEAGKSEKFDDEICMTE